jgi:hypothetical protein
MAGNLSANIFWCKPISLHFVKYTKIVVRLKTVYQTVALLFLLVIFPMGSWYYLKTGFAYRKNALNELKPYGNLNSFELKDVNVNVFKIDSSHVYLFQILKSDEIDKYLSKILTAYEARTDVSAVLVDCHGGSTTDSTNLKGVLKIEVNESLCNAIAKVSGEVQNDTKLIPNILLMNSKGEFVQGYNIVNSEDRARLIKHVSITMPGVKKVEKISKKTTKEI